MVDYGERVTAVRRLHETLLSMQGKHRHKPLRDAWAETLGLSTKARTVDVIKGIGDVISLSDDARREVLTIDAPLAVKQILSYWDRVDAFLGLENLSIPMESAVGHLAAPLLEILYSAHIQVIGLPAGQFSESTVSDAKARAEDLQRRVAVSDELPSDAKAALADLLTQVNSILVAYERAGASAMESQAFVYVAKLAQHRRVLKRNALSPLVQATQSLGEWVARASAWCNQNQGVLIALQTAGTLLLGAAQLRAPASLPPSPVVLLIGPGEVAEPAPVRAGADETVPL